MLRHVAAHTTTALGTSVRRLHQVVPRPSSERLNGIQHAATRLRDFTKREFHAGTVTTRTSGMSINELIDHIRPDGHVNPHGNSSLLMLLSTGYAKHARDQDLPLEVARRILSGQQLRGTLTSVTAVVDGLSSSNQSTEGLAYLFQESTDAVAVANGEPLRSSAQRPGSITFTIRRAMEQQDWQLQVPLGQTIFSTGLTSTLIKRQYAMPAASDPLALSTEDYLENVTFDIARSGHVESVDLKIPLVQLTSYRTVGQSMGNIIRTVSAADTHKEEPASQNLEEAVTAYFEALNASPEPVNVWALIIPKAILLTGKIDALARGLVLDQETLHSMWQTSLADHVNDQRPSFKGLLKNSARLVKVLSGGGGWGKKAGLLSLDPDLEYTTRELRDDFGWQFDFDQVDDGHANSKSVGRQIDQALGASVEEGDGIVFFIAPSKVARAHVSGVVNKDLALGTARLDFTVHASSNARESTDKAAAVEDEVAHVPNSFGVASETGLGLKIREHDSLVNKSKLEIPGAQVAVTIG